MAKDRACATCGIPEADQHSLREGGICDGIRAGKLVVNDRGELVEKETGKVVKRPRRF